MLFFVIAKRTLYIFIDESGNFDFNAKGTRFFVLTGFVSFYPSEYRESFLKLRYELLAKGFDQESFHATEDRQTVRDEIYNLLGIIGDTFEIYAVVAEKSKVSSMLSEGLEHTNDAKGTALYQTACQTLLKQIFQSKTGQVDNVVVVLGSLFVEVRRSAIRHTLKRSLKDYFPGIPFEIYWHRSHSDINCQLADYCSWAIFVKRERDEPRPYEKIASMIKSEFEMSP